MANISNIDFIKIGIDQNGVVHYVNAAGAWDILPLGGSGDCCDGTITAAGNVTIESTGGSVGVDASDEVNIEAVNNVFLGSVNGTITAQSRGNATLQSTNGNVLINSPSGGVIVNGVKTYKALLTQTGTDAPVATVLQNTLGGTVVWTRNGVGSYQGTLVGAFTANKTLIITALNGDAGLAIYSQAQLGNADEFYFYALDTAYTAVDYGDIVNIIIEVYP